MQLITAVIIIHIDKFSVQSILDSLEYFFLAIFDFRFVARYPEIALKRIPFLSWVEPKKVFSHPSFEMDMYFFGRWAPKLVLGHKVVDHPHDLFV